MSAERLKEIRKHIGLNQNELAEKLEIQPHRIRDVENEKQKISVEIAQKIEEKFYISGWWLLTGEGEMIKNGAAESLSENEKKIIYSYRKLPAERQEWYYFKIIAESLD